MRSLGQISNFASGPGDSDLIARTEMDKQGGADRCRLLRSKARMVGSCSKHRVRGMAAVDDSTCGDDVYEGISLLSTVNFSGVL